MIAYPAYQNIKFITGQFAPDKHPDFRKIPEEYTNKVNVYLLEETLDAFIQMYEAAKQDGISLIIKSATRNFDYQKRIWEAKWSGSRILSNGLNAKKDIPNPKLRAQEIMKYSAMPGASRHHWGTDIDLNAFENSYFEKGEGLKVYTWLEANSEKFGFYQVYTAKGEERPHGYEEEKWHWTYKPISKHITAYCKQAMQDSLLVGFSGSDQAESLKVTDRYILGIHPNCH